MKKHRRPLKYVYIQVNLKEWHLLPFKSGTFDKDYRIDVIITFLCFKLNFQFDIIKVE